MSLCLRVLVVLCVLSVGCADFKKEEDAFCERNPASCGEQPVPPGPASLVFSSVPQTVQVGSCSAVTAVELRDTQGRPVNATAATVVELSVSPADGVQFFTQAGCSGTAVTSVTISASSSSASFYFRGTRVGAATLTAAASTLSVNQGVTVTSGPPATLAVTLPASPVMAGTCLSGGLIQVKDATGLDSRVSVDTFVSLQVAPASSIAFYADAACTSAVTSVTVVANSGSAPFFLQAQVTGTLTVTASATGLTSGSQNVTAVPGAGNRLAFLSPPRTVSADVCSQVVQVQSQDAQGNASPVNVATSISLSATPGTGFKFYSDVGCTTGVASISLTTGASDASFYFKGTQAGSVSVTVLAPNLTGSSQTETINPGPPASIFLGGPQTVPAGNCSAPITVALRDAFGNTVTVGANTQISLSAAGVAVTLHNNSGCTGTAVTSVTIAQNASSASLFVRGTVTGTATITGSLTGVFNAMVVVTIAPGPATVLAFSTGAQTVQAGSCSAVTTVQQRDALANGVNVGADTAVNLSAGAAAGVQFFTQAGCGGTSVTSVTLPTGSSSASFYFRTNRAGTPTLTAATSNITGMQTQTITAAAPTVLAFTQTPPLTAVAGVCTQVNLQVQDVHGNASNVASNQAVTLAANPAAGFTIYSNAGCTTSTASVTVTAGQSGAMFYVSGTAAGSVTVNATRAGFTSGTLAMTVNPGPPNRISFSTTVQSVAVNACSGNTTVQVRDAFNNASVVAASTPINLTGSTANIIFYANVGCTGQVTSVTVPAGQSSASFYFKDSVVENPTITAASTGLTSGTQQQTITPLQPTALVFTTAVQSVTADSCSGLVRVEAQSQGAPTVVSSNTLVTLSASPATGFIFYANATCTTPVTEVTIAVGQSNVAFYFKGTKAGTFGLTAASTGLTSAGQNATITPQAAGKIVFVTPSRTVPAGNCSAIVTIQVADSFDNPTNVTGTEAIALIVTAGDAAFKLFTDANCSAPAAGTTSVSIPAGQGTVSFYFRGLLARSLTVTASPSSFASTTQTETITGGTATALVFSAATPGETLLAGDCSAIRTVESRDAFGNPSLDALAITLGPSGQAEFFSDSTCTTLISQLTISAGNSSASLYFKGISGGINANALLDLTASSGALTPGSQTETIIPMVRTGSCIIAANLVSGTCSITPALASMDKAFLTFQATTLNTTSAQANVRCFLNSTSQVRCERGTNNASNLVNIEWSVAEFPTIVGIPGVSVQRTAQNCSATTTSITVTPAVVRENSFLLLSSRRGSVGQGNAIFRIAELTSTTQAQIRKQVDCNDADTNHLQVIEYPGTSVQRGVTSLANGSASVQVTLANTVTLGRSILLYSYTSDGSGAAICNRALRGELSSNAVVTFSRGTGNTANCTGSQLGEISWEVVQFPAGTVVQQVTQQLAAAELTKDIPIGPIDRSRTVVFAGGQWASGQAHGEGQYATNELISEMRARASLVSTNTVRLTRETANSSATFTVYVVQLKP